MPYQPKRLDRYQVMMNNLDGMVAWDSIARMNKQGSIWMMRL